jgi:hypothetical protein
VPRGQAVVRRRQHTNVTRAERASYIAPARAAGFHVVGYFFAADPKAAFARNRARSGKAVMPAAGLFGTQKRLEPIEASREP